MTIFDFADALSVSYAEGYQAGRIIEARANMARLGPVLRFGAASWREFTCHVKGPQAA